MNFTDAWNKPVVQKEYKQVPTGTYNATLVQADIQMSPDEKHKLKLRYKINTNDEFNGLLIFSQFNLYETGLNILKQELPKMGIDKASVKSLIDLEAAFKNLVNKDFVVFAQQRTYAKSDGTIGYSHNVYVEQLVDGKPLAAAPKVNTGDELPF